MIRKIKDGIISAVRKNETCYFFVKLLKQFKYRDFREFVLSYRSSDIVWVRHLCADRGLSPRKLIYKITVGEENMGFFAVMRHIITSLSYAEFYSLIPVIGWYGGNYAEVIPINGTDNVFEYYFQSLSEIRYEDIPECQNVVIDYGQRIGFPSMTDGYRMQNQFVEYFAELYRKYIKLNSETQSFIEQNKKSILGAKKTLGIHVRGTDYKQAFDQHPVCLEVKDFIEPTKKLIGKYGYEQIFLATDSLEAVKILSEIFGEKLVYYMDVYRSDGNIGIHCLENDRERHHYMLGLEILRDAYTLAACDSLLAGFSQVSFAAQYIKIANGEKYKEVFFIDHGIHHNNKEARRILNKKTK